MGKDRRERRALEGKGGQEVAAGVDNTHRKTWNKDEYAAKAAERERKVQTSTFEASGYQLISYCVACSDSLSLQEQKDEESSLDAKKRRRLGNVMFR